MALRAIVDAKRHGGLFEKAIFQLQRNFENADQSARKTWMGRLTNVVRKTWPRFRVETFPSFHLSGVPPWDPSIKISKHFTESTWIANWKKRQIALFSSPPTLHQQDFLLY